MANKSIKEESYYKNFQKYLKEDALDQSNPIGLSQLDKNLATAASTSGTQDNDPKDDAAAANPSFKSPAKDLNPSQKQIILIKSFNQALNTTGFGGKYPEGGNLDAIISSDGYIMDGHHRWAATILIDPNISVGGTQIGLPAKELITALNVYTKGALNIDKGNEGQGDIAAFTGDNLQKTILDVAEKTGKSPDSPDGKAPGYSWEDLKARIAKKFGTYEKGIEIMKANAAVVSGKTVEGWMPNRSDMPVIDANDVSKVADAVKVGEIDIKVPYADSTKQAMESYSPVKNSLFEAVLEKSIKIINKQNKRKK
jgi:hypothetical protein